MYEDRERENVCQMRYIQVYIYDSLTFSFDLIYIFKLYKFSNVERVMIVAIKDKIFLNFLYSLQIEGKSNLKREAKRV